MNLAEIVRRLKQNQVVAYPTEAVFGLGCNPNSRSAVENLLILKRRTPDKGLILIAPELEFLLPFIDVSKLQAPHWQRLQAEYGRPVTWVVPAGAGVAEFLTGRFDSIAVRLCRHAAVKRLCEQSGFALTSTSANLAGLPPCKTAQQVRSQFGEDFPVLDMPVGDAANPSEIRDIFTQQIFRGG